MSYNIFFRSNLTLKDIIIDYKERDNTKIDLWASDIGSNFFLYLHNKNDEEGGLIIDNKYLIKLKINNNSFYPTIDLIFRDPTFIIGNKLHPDDNTILSLFKKSNSKLLMSIRLDFIITNFRIIKEIKNSSDRIYSIKAYLNFNDYIENNSYKGTSFAVLQNLALKCDLGFASNINDTNDSMVWINPGYYISEFIPKIVKNSFRSNNSFLYTFIDLYCNLNYVDIELQFDENTLKNKTIFNTKSYTNDKESISDLILTNHPNLIGSNMYIDKYIIDNSAKDINWNIGLKSEIYYYNKTDNEYLIKDIDTITSNKGNLINLKTVDEYENKRKFYLGFQDNDNVHENYLYSIKLNENNINFKIKMNIILDNVNMSLYRFQYVEIIIYELETLYSEGDSKNKTDSYRINDKLSGSWLITGISYLYDRGQSSQEISLVRRDLNIEYDKVKLDDITKYFYLYKKQIN